MTSCAVIGGGIAGLSAAVRLAERGTDVVLIEARPLAGGRAFAFNDAATGDTVDNGQHLLMGCYTDLLDYMATIGTATKLAPIRRMRVPFVSPGGMQTVLSTLPLPWPLDTLSAFLGFDALPLKQRFGLLRVAAQAAFTPRDSMQHMDSMSVSQWLAQCKQSPEAVRMLWEPIVLATMNAKPDEASAYLFMVVLKDAFLAGKKAATFLVPQSDLSSLLVEPGVDFIHRNGGHVLLHSPVKAIEHSDTGYSVHTADGALETKSLICAVPPRAFTALADTSSALADTHIPTDAFIPSLIISAHLWLCKEITEERMTGFHGTTLQWLFPQGRSQDGSWRYAGVISAANHLAKESNEALHSMITRELLAVYPHLVAEDILRIKCTRERAATFLPLPGMEVQRPAADVLCEGLFLAGDWTSVSLPATLEGAARSGHKAAEKTLQFLQLLAAR